MRNTMAMKPKKLFILWGIAILMTSCVYQGGERATHVLVRPDGIRVTCVEPPPEVVKLGNFSGEVDSSAKEIGLLAKATVRGEVKPERIREKLPTNVQTFEAVHFRLCFDYGNDLLTKSEYQAYLDARGGLSREERSMKTREKPEITIKTARIVGSIEENASPKATVIFENTGRATALRTKANGAIGIFPVPVKELPEQAPALPFKGTESMVSLGVGHAVEGVYELRLLKKKEVEQLKSRDSTIVVFGVVRYDDNMGRQYTTEFCLYWKNLDSQGLTICNRWNETTEHGDAP